VYWKIKEPYAPMKELREHTVSSEFIDEMFIDETGRIHK